MKKYDFNLDVNQSARIRIQFLLKHFPNFYVSFSGGKDSGVLLNLAIEEAEKVGRLPVDVLIIDFEAQYISTIDFIMEMVATGKINPFWVCLPISLRNAVSQFQPKWVCWDPLEKSKWIRQYPSLPTNQPPPITRTDYFPFYQYGMEFEDFVVEFAKWYQTRKKTPIAILIGIRSDESLNRYRTIKNTRKTCYDNQRWTTKLADNAYSAFPIYDWTTEDIWIANGRFQWPYNRIYDLMYKAGVSLAQQRLCQPFGDDQRKGLWLYQILEPLTWQRLVERVEGCNFGARYSKDQGRILGYYRFILPEGYTYRSYSKFLLDTMPPHAAKHYRQRIHQFLLWWKNHRKEHGIRCIPDSADPKLESRKKVPSWRRICKVLIKNDYWCYGLSFGQNQTMMKHYQNIYADYFKKERL